MLVIFYLWCYNYVVYGSRQGGSIYMKKYLKLLLVTLILFTISGCGSKKKEEVSLTPVEVITKTISNQKASDEGKVIITLDMKLNYDGVNIDMPVSLTIDAKKVDDNRTNMKMVLSDNPYIGSQTLYLDYSGKNAITYMQGDLIAKMIGMEDNSGYWIKQEVEADDSEKDESLYTDVNAKLEEFKKIDFGSVFTSNDVILVNKDGDVGQYRIHVTKDLLVRLSKLLGEEESLYNDFNGSMDVDVYINTKSNLLNKVVVNALDFVKNIKVDEEEESLFDPSMFERLNLSMEIKYDGVDVSIPSEVVSKAITSEEYGNILASKSIG